MADEDFNWDDIPLDDDEQDDEDYMYGAEDIVHDIVAAWDRWYQSGKSRNEYTLLKKTIEDARVFVGADDRQHAYLNEDRVDTHDRTGQVKSTRYYRGRSID